MPRIPGRRHTVEEVAASRDGFEQVVGISHTHQVARTVFRQLLVQQLQHRPHVLLGLANTEPPNAESGPIAGTHEVTRVLASKVFEDIALQHRKKHLGRHRYFVLKGRKPIPAPLEPTQRAYVSRPGRSAVRSARRAFVEGHDHVRA